MTYVSNAAVDGFAALGDPTRRAIFARLSQRPAAVGELAAGLPVSRPAVSQHLRVLKQAGLVTETPDGTRRIYRLDPRGIGAMRDWLDAYWATALGAFQAFADREFDNDPQPQDSEPEESPRMSIAPIIQSVEVKAVPARAFELFTGQMENWWPKGRTVAKNPHVAIVMEPHAGGAWFERDADGAEVHWGKVLAWEPPSRLLLAWQLNSQWTYDPDFLTEVEMTFAPLDGGGTKVTLEHRKLERFGADAEARAASLNGGWPRFMAEFGQYADREGWAAAALTGVQD